MIWIAIAIQIILSAGLLWASWQVWMLRKALKATVLTVDGWTRACENGLQGSSPSLDVARDGIGTARKQYQTLQTQSVKIRKLVSVFGRGVSFVSSRWKQVRQAWSNPSNNKSNNKSSSKSSGSRLSRSKNNVKRRR